MNLDFKLTMKKYIAAFIFLGLLAVRKLWGGRPSLMKKIKILLISNYFLLFWISYLPAYSNAGDCKMASPISLQSDPK